MKAQFVHENINFERGLDPKKVMGIGIEEKLKKAMKEKNHKHYDNTLSLEWAAEQGHKHFVEYLLSKEDINFQNHGRKLMSAATESDDLEILKMLVDAGLEPNWGDGIVFFRNIIGKTDSTDMLEFIISKGWDISTKSQQLAISQALNKKDEDWIKLLIDSGLDVSDVNLFNYNIARKPGKYLLDYMSKLAAEKHS